MKKIYLFIMLCAMSVAVASCGGCSNNNSDDWNDDEVYDEDNDKTYRELLTEACDDRDFVRAYQLADPDEEDINFVVKQEAAYVLESQGEKGLVRLQMIVNEHNASWLYLDMLKVAISMGDETLATKLYKMGNQCDEQAVDYAITADMEDLIIAFLNRNTNYIDKRSVIDYLEEKGLFEKTVSVINKKKLEEKANTEKADNAKLAANIREKLKKVTAKVEGIKPPKGLQDYWLGSELLDGKTDWTVSSNPQYITYFVSSQSVNTELGELLSDAIKTKDLSLCKEIIASYKETIEVTKGDSDSNVKVDGQIVDGNHSYIKYTYADKIAAQKVLDGAIRSGEFK